jgi:hypothetical protein
MESSARDLAGEVGLRADRARQAIALIREQVEYDEEGNPTNLEKLLKGRAQGYARMGGHAAEPRQGARLRRRTRPTPPSRRATPDTFDPKRPPRLTDPGIWKDS